MEKLIHINKPLIKFLKKLIIKTFYTDKRPGVNIKHNLEHIIEGILRICKTGIQYSFSEYKGISPSVLKYHFYKWSTANFFDKCWKHIYNEYQKMIKYNTNLRYLSIDTTFIKSMNGKDCVGSNPTDRGRKANKLSVIVDLLGVPVAFLLAEANKPDQNLMRNTLDEKIYKRKTKSKIYGDKGYSSRKCISAAEDNNLIMCAENKKNFKNLIFPVNININEYRYVIEAFNSWLKSNKRIILRYDRYSANFKSYIMLAFCMVINTKVYNKSGKIIDMI
jgi:hypothetical protein